MLRLLRIRFAPAALAGACFAVVLVGNAVALDYPTRQPHIIVGYPPGGSTDILARLIGDWLAKTPRAALHRRKPSGAGNNLGTEVVVRRKPDGYTLILVNPANTINASLYKHLNFVFLRDIDPVADVIRVPNVMEVTPGGTCQDVAEFIAYAKANPDKVNVASSGNGTSIHLSGELFILMTGLKMTHVPYKGSAPTLIDLLGRSGAGDVRQLPSSIEHIKAGKLRRARGDHRHTLRPRSCLTCRRSARPCQATKRAHSSALACRTERRRKSSICSTRRSTGAQGSGMAPSSRTWAASLMPGTPAAVR